MLTASNILELAETFASAHDLPLSTVSTRVFGDGKKLAAIRDDDADLTLRRATSAVEWFSENWPRNARWPRSIPRPVNSDAQRRRSA